MSANLYKRVTLHLPSYHHVNVTKTQLTDSRHRVLKDTTSESLNKKRSSAENDDTSSKRRRLADIIDTTEQHKLDAIAEVLQTPSQNKLEAISKLLDNEPRPPIFDDNDGIDRCAHCMWEIIYDYDQGDEHYGIGYDDEKDIEPVCARCEKECKYDPEDWVTTDDEAGLESDDEVFLSDDSGDEEDRAYINDAESDNDEEDTNVNHDIKQEPRGGELIPQLFDIYDTEDSMDVMAGDFINEDDKVRLQVEEALASAQPLQDGFDVNDVDELSIDDMAEDACDEVDDEELSDDGMDEDGLDEIDEDVVLVRQSLPAGYQMVGACRLYRDASQEL